MFDHVGIVVKDLIAAKDFYVAGLRALGVRLLQDNSQPTGEGWLVFGAGGAYPFFVVASGRPSFWNESHEASASPDHLAFAAPSEEAVDRFYELCIENGGRDNGPPGERSGGSYYAAYVIDPDGNNVEAGHRR